MKSILMCWKAKQLPACDSSISVTLHRTGSKQAFIFFQIEKWASGG